MVGEEAWREAKHGMEGKHGRKKLACLFDAEKAQESLQWSSHSQDTSGRPNSATQARLEPVHCSKLPRFRACSNQTLRAQGVHPPPSTLALSIDQQKHTSVLSSE